MSLIQTALQIAFDELKALILESSDPYDAVQRAKRAIVADAADIATDTAIDEALKLAKKT
jgi:hypothetical protein